MQLNLFHSQEARSEKKALISNNNARAKYESCTRWRFLTVIATVVLVSYLNGKNKAYIFARLLLNYFSTVCSGVLVKSFLLCLYFHYCNFVRLVHS